MSDPFADVRSFPKASAPNDNASTIRGNCSIEHKQLAVDMLMRNGAGKPTTWGHDVIKRMKIVEINVRPRRYASSHEAGMQSGLEVEVVYEVTVQEGMSPLGCFHFSRSFMVLDLLEMLNYAGVVSGSCIGHLVDICTFGAMHTLGIEQGRDASGLSQAVEIQYLGAALPGMTLGIVATTMSGKGRILNTRVEIYNKSTGELVATGMQMISSRKPDTLAPSRSAKQAKM